MKKLILALLLASMLLSVTSCSFKDDYDEIEESTDSKKKISVGMSLDEVKENYTDKYYEINLDIDTGYLFIDNKKGFDFIVEYDIESNQVTNVERTKNKTGKSESFENIKNGMTFYEVVEAVGFPIKSYLNNFVFADSKGDTYYIFFSSESLVRGMRKINTDGADDNIYIGMSGKDLNKVLEDSSKYKNCFTYRDYVFFEDENGKNVVVALVYDENNELKVSEVKRFEKSAGTNSEIEELDNISVSMAGLDVFAVVEKFGLPIDSYTFGMVSMVFVSSEGSEYSIYFDTMEMTTTGAVKCN